MITGSFSHLIAHATRSCKLYRVASSKDIEKDIHILKELCFTCWHKQNHLFFWSQCTSKRSKLKQEKYKHLTPHLKDRHASTGSQQVSFDNFQIIESSYHNPFTASTHSYLLSVINAKTHLWDTALPMHKVSFRNSPRNCDMHNVT